MYVFLIICVLIKQVENSNVTFSYHHLSIIVNEEDSESSLKVVQSHDS